MHVISVQHVHGKGGCAGNPARDICMKGVRAIPFDKPSSGVGLQAGTCGGKLQIHRGRGLLAGRRGETTTS